MESVGAPLSPSRSTMRTRGDTDSSSVSRAQTAPIGASRVRRVSRVAESKGLTISTATMIKRRARQRKDPDRMFRWNAGENEGDVRRNISSSEAYLRKMRVAKSQREDPELYSRLRRDLRIEMEGPHATKYRENCRRSMGAALIRCLFYRYLDHRRAAAFFKWSCFAVDKPTLKEFVRCREALYEARERMTVLMGEVKDLSVERDQLAKDLSRANIGETVSAERMAELEASLQTKEQKTMFLFVKRMCHAKLKVALLKWQQGVKDSERLKYRRRRALAFWVKGCQKRIFAAWAQHVRNLKARRLKTARARRAAKKWTHRLVMACFQTWAQSLKEHKRQRLMIQRCIMRIKKRALFSTFSSWIEYVESARSYRAKVARASRHWQSRHARMMFAAWEEYVAKTKQNRLLVVRSLKRMQNRALAAVFSRWEEFLTESSELRRKVRKALGMWRSRQLALVFFKWCESVSEIKRARELMWKVLCRIENGALFSGFVTWYAGMKSGSERQQILRSIVEKLKNRQLAKGFKTWFTVCTEAGEIQRKLRKAIGAWTLGIMLRSLNKWRDEVAIIKRHRRLVSRAAQRIKMRHAAAAWGTWNDFIARRTFMRKFIKKMVGRYQNRELAKGINGWRVYMAHAELAAERAAMRAEREAVRQRQMRNIILRIKNRQAATAMHSWKASVTEIKRLRTLLKRAGMKVRMRAASSAMAAWVDFADRRRGARSFLSKMVGRWSNKEIASGWASWCAYIDLEKRAKMEAERRRQLMRNIVLRVKNRAKAAVITTWVAVVAETKRQRAIMERAAARIRNRALAASVASWLDFVERRVFARNFLGKMVGRWKNKEKAGAWESWRLYLKAVIAAEAEEARRKKVMKNIVLRIRNRLAATAMETWTTTVNETKRQRLLVARSLGRIKMRRAASAFATWIDHVDRRAFARNFVNKMIGRWQNAELAKGWHGWERFDIRKQMWLRGEGMESELANARAAEEKRKEQLMRNIVLRIRNRAAALAFHGWMSVVEERKKNRAMLKRAAAKLRNRSLSAAVSTWIEMVQRRVFARSFLNKMVGRWKNKEVSMGWASWLAYLEELHKARIKLERQDQMLRNIVLRIRNRRAAIAIETWSACVENTKRHRLMVARTLARIKLKAAAAALETWLGYVERRVFARRFLVKMTGRWKNSELAKGWNAWTLYDVLARRQPDSMVSELERMRRERANARLRVMNNIVQRIKHRETSTAYVTWLFNVRAAKRYRVLLARSAGRIRNRGLAGAFDAWIDLVERRMLCRDVLNRAVRRYSNRELSMGLNAWRLFVLADRMGRAGEEGSTELLNQLRAERERSQRATMQSIISRIRNRSLNAALQSWIAMVALAKRHRVLLARAANRIRNRTLAMAFEAALDFVERRNFAREFLNRMVRRWRNQEIAGAFRSWSVWLVAQRNNQRDDQELIDNLRRMKESQYRRQQQQMRNIMLRIKYRAASLALEAWKTMAQHEKRRRLVVKRAALKWRNRSLAASLEAWLHFLERRQFAREFMLKFERRFLLKDQAKGMNAWRTFTQWHRSESSRDSQLKQQLRDALARENARRERTVKNILFRIKMRDLSRAFYGWEDTARLRRDRRVRVKLTLTRWRNRTMARAWLSWCADVRRKFYWRVLKSPSMTPACHILVRCVTGKKRNRGAVRRSIGRIMHRHLHAGFQAWRSKVLAKVRARKEMARVIVKLAHVKLRRAWRKFKSVPKPKSKGFDRKREWEEHTAQHLRSFMQQLRGVVTQQEQFVNRPWTSSASSIDSWNLPQSGSGSNIRLEPLLPGASSNPFDGKKGDGEHHDDVDGYMLDNRRQDRTQPGRFYMYFDSCFSDSSGSTIPTGRPNTRSRPNLMVLPQRPHTSHGISRSVQNNTSLVGDPTPIQVETDSLSRSNPLLQNLGFRARPGTSELLNLDSSLEDGRVESTESIEEGAVTKAYSLLDTVNDGLVSKQAVLRALRESDKFVRLLKRADCAPADPTKPRGWGKRLLNLATQVTGRISLAEWRRFCRDASAGGTWEPTHQLENGPTPDLRRFAPDGVSAHSGPSEYRRSGHSRALRLEVENQRYVDHVHRLEALVRQQQRQLGAMQLQLQAARGPTGLAVKQQPNPVATIPRQHSPRAFLESPQKSAPAASQATLFGNTASKLRVLMESSSKTYGLTNSEGSVEGLL